MPIWNWSVPAPQKSLISTDARWHNHANHKRSHHHHLGSYISLPLSPSPTSEPAETPEELEPEPDPPHSSTDVFDVRHFGAVGDGITDDTESFKMAWYTACQSNSLSVIFVPYGFSFMIQSTIFTGPCQRGIMLQVDGTIMPPDGPDSWPKNSSRRQWLVFYRINEMSLLGGGLIDGRGQKWWDLPCKPHKHFISMACTGDKWNYVVWTL